MKSAKTTEGPDISQIINNLTQAEKKTDNLQVNSHQSQAKIEDDSGMETTGNLWKEFMECLNVSEAQSSVRTKLYTIDDDIVETLHQCEFGKPNVHVINCILRTFLVENIPRLRQMYRPRSKTILDQYP